MRKWIAAAGIAILAVLVVLFGPWFEEADEVTVYTSVDQVYSEPILKAFEEKTGIHVKPLYDAEAAKTVGLANRLIAEKDNPLADVFWNGEFIQTLALKKDGVLASYDAPAAKDLPVNFVDPDRQWTAFGGRARVIIVNTALVDEADRPAGLSDLVARPRDVAFANPLFGSTLTHAAALSAALGIDQALAIFTDLKDGGARVVDGNAVVRDMVAAGQVAMGLTDTDDACVAIEKEAEVAVIFPDQEEDGLGTVVVPNTVALVAGAPHQRTGKALVDFLLSPETEAALIEAGWIQIPSRPGLGDPPCYGNLDVRAMDLPMSEIHEGIEAIGQKLRKAFQN